MNSNLLNANARYKLSCHLRTPVIIDVIHPNGTVDHVLLPFDAFESFLFTPLDHDVEIHGQHLTIQKYHSFMSHWHTPKRILRKSRFAAPLHFGGCIYTLKRPAKGAPRQSLLDNRGMDLGSESLATLQSSAMILDEVPTLPDGDAPAPEFAGTIAFVLHLHYAKLWDEFATFFKHTKLSFRLYVTLTEPNEELSRQIRTEFPNSVIALVENLGRDIRPFVELLQSGQLEDIDLICKLHGKRSIASGVTGARFGHLWRRRALLDLLGSPKHLQSILNSFEANPHFGLMGPATLRLKNGSGIDPGFETSLDVRKNLCRKTNINPSHIREDFFAGTMFWARKDALKPMQNLRLSNDDYTRESAQTGDQFEHALERFFADCVRATGFEIADIEPLPLSKTKVPIRSKTGQILAPHALFEGQRAMYSSSWSKPVRGEFSGRKVAMVSNFEHVESKRAEGCYTCLCLSGVENSLAAESNADAIFCREVGGFDTALFADAFKQAPSLWQASQIHLVSKSVSCKFSPSDNATRARLERSLVWHRESEATHRFNA